MQSSANQHSSVSFIGWGIKLEGEFPEKTWRKLYNLAIKNKEISKSMSFERFVFGGSMMNSIHESIDGTDLICYLNDNNGKLLYWML